MITYSGVHIQKIGGVEGTPTSMDIAVHSGRLCRYGGAVWMPLLAHLVFVGALAYKRSGSVANLLWGFLHDAHEAVTADVPRPFKCDCMREEQQAIDVRILFKFFELRWPDQIHEIDFDLIKRCDIDACHIEAVALGLPGFAEVELAYARKKAIHGAVDDKELFQRIFGGPFYNFTTDGEGSLGVRKFANALKLAEAGQYENMLSMVKGWRLL